MKRFIMTTLCMITLTSSALLCMEQQVKVDAEEQNKVDIRIDARERVAIESVTMVPFMDACNEQCTEHPQTIYLAGYVGQTCMVVKKEVTRYGTYYEFCPVKNPYLQFYIDEKFFNQLLEKTKQAQVAYGHLFPQDYKFQMYPENHNPNGRYAATDFGTLRAEETVSSDRKPIYYAKIWLNAKEGAKELSGNEARVVFMTLNWIHKAGYYTKITYFADGKGDMLQGQLIQ